ncbi:TlpA disulfide reductase family protein [Salegentibacter sediminis]|uniref:TlpA disulfide reductase family protein n=1 Tax=Salegentibacter sediminis TaxID=1930251 RepID=UPI0009BE4B0A|nr:TlpA disulfide reductase family protein [Salegentibacter sediminis]
MISKKLILLSLISFNVVLAQKNDFSLSGKTSGIKDGTYLYLRDLVNGGNIDSALVKDNEFLLNTNLPEPVLYVMIFTKDRKNFKDLWLEKNPMTFNATKNTFINAKVTGSETQNLSTKMQQTVYANVKSTPKDSLKLREKKFINLNPNSVLSAYILDGNQRWSQNEIGEYFSKLSRDVQVSSIGQKIKNDLDKDIPDLGEKYNDFSAPNPMGIEKKISELKGQLTLLQFWSSSCSHSRGMNKKLTQVYSKYHPKGFEIISVSNDVKKSNWIEAIKEDNLTWPQLSNLDNWNGKIFSGYGIHSTPTNFLIDKNGEIVARNLRGDDLEKEIKEHLK